jgi:hypothetical protein
MWSTEALGNANGYSVYSVYLGHEVADLLASDTHALGQFVQWLEMATHAASWLD